MAAGDDWETIYRETYSAEELAVEITRLKTQIQQASGYVAQGVGQHSYQRDLGELRRQLAAAAKVRRDAGAASGEGRMALADFSGARFD